MVNKWIALATAVLILLTAFAVPVLAEDAPKSQEKALDICFLPLPM